MFLVLVTVISTILIDIANWILLIHTSTYVHKVCMLEVVKLFPSNQTFLNHKLFSKRGHVFGTNWGPRNPRNIIASNQFTGCIFFFVIGWTSSGWKKKWRCGYRRDDLGLNVYAKWMSYLENNLWLNIWWCGIKSLWPLMCIVLKYIQS